MSTRKRGLYVRYQGEELPVTGPRQSKAVAAQVPVGRTLTITRWTGSEWVDTGLVLHGQRAS